MQSTKRITLTAALLLAGLATIASAGPPLDSGALDPTFGSGGKVQFAAAATGLGGSSLVATDVVVQPGGRIIVSGHDDVNDCLVAAFTGNGNLDSSFYYSGHGLFGGFTGYGECTYNGIAIRPDGRIVAVGNSEGATLGEVDQFTASGAPDATFGTLIGDTSIVPDSENDRIYLARAIIDTDGTIVVAGTYYQYARNVNRFFFARISADGKTVEPFSYEFGSGNNQDDHAQDLAIDNQGRYVVVGYHRGASGNYDFAAIRIHRDLYDVDNAFGSGGQTTIDFGDNGDYANAVVLTSTGYIALGGQANGQAALALLDPNGNLNQYFSSGLLYPERFTFNFGIGGGNDTITKLVFGGYDTKYPQLLALGSGSQNGVPYGLMFGIARLNFPGIYSNFGLDSGFSGNGTEGVYINTRPDGIGLTTTTNHGRSAAFANGKLVVVGDTIESGGTGMAVARLGAFDGIFKNGFDTPSL